MTESNQAPPQNTTILIDSIVPAGEPWSTTIQAGDVLRLIDLEGQQAVDFICYNAEDRTERYHWANTIKLSELGKNLYIGHGSILRSNKARPMMSVVKDTCGGHDTIWGCCSFELDQFRFGKTNAECCQRNFERELAKHGMDAQDIVPNVNFFMSVPVTADGNAALSGAHSQAGDYVDLRAEMDVISVLSNCPEALNEATGAGPSPIRVMVFRPTSPSESVSARFRGKS